MYIGFVHNDDMKAHDKLSVTICWYNEAGVTASLIVTSSDCFLKKTKTLFLFIFFF